MDTIEARPMADGADEARAKVRAILAAEGKSQKALSDEAGIAYQTFSAWLGATYQGNNDAVTTKVGRWLESRRERQSLRVKLPAGDGYIATETARAILPILQFAHHMPAFTAVVGVAGVGKTRAAEHYRDSTPNVWMTTAQPSVRKVAHILSRLCCLLEIPQGGRADTLAPAIVSRVRGREGLLIIDEAQFLDLDTIQQLRVVQDLGHVGVALMGNEEVIGRLGYGDPRRSNVSSRVGKRLVLTAAQPADVDALLDAWGIADPEQRQYLAGVARRPGALRTMTWCWRQATILAAGCEEPLGLKHLRASAQDLCAEPTSRR